MSPPSLKSGTKILVVERVLPAEVLNAERQFLGNVGEQRVILNHLTTPQDPVSYTHLTLPTILRV